MALYVNAPGSPESCRVSDQSYNNLAAEAIHCRIDDVWLSEYKIVMEFAPTNPRIKTRLQCFVASIDFKDWDMEHDKEGFPYGPHGMTATYEGIKQDSPTNGLHIIR